MSCPVKVGSEFNSYEELLAAVREFEADQCVAYYKRVFNMIDPALKYYEIKFTCVKGGKKF